MGRIDAEHGQFLGKKGEFLECEDKRAIVRVPLDIGIELRRKEVATDHVALKLRYVDAVGGKSAECFVERGGNVADPEHEGRDDFAGARLCPFFLAREHDKACGRV